MSARKITLAAVLLVGLTGCGSHSKPNFTFMPDMVYSPAYKAQEGAMRMPVKGTVPRGFSPYPYQFDPEAAGRELKNPLTPTESVLARGKIQFETYCLVCHGPQGEGDGPVVAKFVRPPTFHSDKVRTWTDGRIYHVITAGQGLMQPYASQVAAEDRWAIIHYLRVLQRAKNPTPADLKAGQ